MADRLVAEGHAYYCYCTPDELKARRETAGTREAAGKLDDTGSAWRYDRLCCRLTKDEVAVRERDRIPRAVRFKVPSGDEGTTRFDDLVHGPIAFDGANIEDFVIVRSDGHPTYHLSVVADDVDMAITHVVRGDDHISNTPKHILLYRALGAAVPQFAHVPLILGPDKKRLSKRHGATSVMDYERQGILAEAMVNFLALLGWSPGAGDRELFTQAELAGVFSLEGISGGNAVFNPEKLDWFNQQHMMRLAPDELARRVRPSLEAAGLWSDEFLGDRHGWFFAVLELLRPRVKRLTEFVSQGHYFFTDEIEYDAAAVKKHLTGMADALAALDAAFAALTAFDASSLEAVLRSCAADRGEKAATLIHACRVAVTGKAVSPGLFDVITLLGRRRVHDRLVQAASLASHPHA
jgi:glutamyl-tRNA synthetase